MPEYSKLESASLAQVDDSYVYNAQCQKCDHSSRLSLLKLRTQLGDSFLLRDVRERLRCKACKSRQIVVTFLAPHQRSGSLAEMFDAPFVN